MITLGGRPFSYERGTPVITRLVQPLRGVANGGGSVALAALFHFSRGGSLLLSNAVLFPRVVE